MSNRLSDVERKLVDEVVAGLSEHDKRQRVEGTRIKRLVAIIQRLAEPLVLTDNHAAVYLEKAHGIDAVLFLKALRGNESEFCEAINAAIRKLELADE